VHRRESEEPLKGVLDAVKVTILERLTQSLEMDAAAVQAALETDLSQTFVVCSVAMLR